MEPSRRPKDGRYGENPNRLQEFYQYQVLLKPSPDDVLDVYLESVREIGISLEKHDVRFVEDDWESPTLAAAGLGWEVWLDGMEITQFTYFQQIGGFELDPISVELTYGLERLAMYVQGVDHIRDVLWNDHLKWADVRLEAERDFSRYNFEEANVELHFRLFNDWEAEARAAAGSGSPVSRIRRGSEVLALLQCARCARGDQPDGARVLHRPGARTGGPGGEARRGPLRGGGRSGDGRMTAVEVHHDPEARRFFASVDGEESYMIYQEKDESTVDFLSTFTPPGLRGRGIARHVVNAALAWARSGNKDVIPSCWYVRRILENEQEAAR